MAHQHLYESEFDKYVEHYDEMRKYSTRAGGHSLDYYDEYKIKEIARDLGAVKCAEPITILNYGCGIGKSEPYFVKYFPNAKIVSVDVSQKSLDYAKEKLTQFPQISFHYFDGHSLPFDFKFDIIFISNVFHHIEHEKHNYILTYLKSSLTKTGYIYMFEHNPINPLTRKAVVDCVFDENAVLLNPKYAKSIYKVAGYTEVRIRYTLFFPAALSSLSFVERFLNFIPIGAQYYIRAR